ncbi:MAG: hypothetical protein EOO08_07700 [Chitinophagaceae bacterium]|nr:MAG: hypothetical protein EOO08_07700 [Chitinophagaceae bacterium]
MQTARNLRLLPSPVWVSRNLQFLSFFLILWIAFPSAVRAQAGLADGTYNFAGLGGAGSGGTGLKTQGDKFVVSDIFVNDGTLMYADNNSPGVEQTVVLQANNTVIKTFTLTNLSVSNFGNTTFPLGKFDITLYDYFGNVIAAHSLAGNQAFTNAGPSIASFNFTTAWPANGYAQVNKVQIKFQYANPTAKPSNMDWKSWALASMSNTVPSSTTVGTLSGTSFCAGSSLSIPFTATGYNAGNTYTAQLSNNAGSFASPVAIGTLSSNAGSGTISATIPSNTTSGSGYRIRIVGSNPGSSPANNPDNGANLTVNPLPTATIGSYSNIACNGGSNGIIVVNAGGGTPGYSYSWSPSGGSGSTASGLLPGTYTVTVTDTRGCTATASQALTQPTVIAGSTVVTNVACFGGNNGAIDLTPSGGTPGYTYSWSGGPTTQDRSSLAAGTYSVVITDANSCTKTISNIVVSQPTAAVSGTTVVTNVACFGGNTGAINLTPNGGTGPYTFNWSGGPTTEDRTGLAAGTYSVIITDNNGCTGTVSNIAVNQPGAPVSGTTVVTNVACFGGNTGAINLTPTGGVGGYTYNWMGGATTEDRTGLTSGTYSVIITDNNGCTGTVSNIAVSQPGAPVSGTTVVTNVACFGGNTGAINLTPNGGTGPYTFNWSGGPTTEDRILLQAGNYSVTITDANGCTGTINNISVNQPSAPLSASYTTNDVSCFGGSDGSINLTPAGGTTPYTFLWNGGATTEDRTGLIAGNYSVTITDAYGCQTTENNIAIYEPAERSATISYDGSPYFTGSGTATVTRTGTDGGTYTAAPGGMSIAPTTGTIDLAASAPGTYTVTYTIASETCGDYFTTASVTLVNPFAATISYDGSPYCASTGTANVTRTGTTGGTYTATPAGLSINSSTGAIDLAASTPGTYTVRYGTTPTDFTTTQVAIRPTTFINAQPNSVLCSGAIYPGATLSGATGLTFTWTATNPAIGIPASGNGTIPSFTVTNSGATAISSYVYVEASGGTGCDLARNMIFRITVNPTPAINTVSDQSLCAGTNTAAVNFVSSVAQTTVSWTNNNTSIGLNATGTGNIASFVARNNTGVMQTATINAVAVAENCASEPFSFTIAVAPSAGSISYPGSPYCQSGPAVPTRNGSAGGTFSAAPAGLDLDPATGSIKLGLSAPGTYTVTYTVAASGGCTATASAQITVNPQAFVDPIPNQVYCNNQVTASIPFTGNAPSYNWSNTDPSIGLAASGSGTSLPSFTTVNPGPGLRYAYVRVAPQGNGSSTCPGKGIVFRFTINSCGPIAGHGDTGGTPDNLRTALQQSFQAGPNPATGSVVLQYTGAEQGPFTVQIVSQYGTPVGKPATMTGTTHTLDLSGITPGSYLLQVTHIKTGITFNKQLIKL